MQTPTVIRQSHLVSWNTIRWLNYIRSYPCSVLLCVWKTTLLCVKWKISQVDGFVFYKAFLNLNQIWVTCKLNVLKIDPYCRVLVRLHMRLQCSVPSKLKSKISRKFLSGKRKTQNTVQWMRLSMNDICCQCRVATLTRCCSSSLLAASASVWQPKRMRMHRHTFVNDITQACTNQSTNTHLSLFVQSCGSLLLLALTLNFRFSLLIQQCEEIICSHLCVSSAGIFACSDKTDPSLLLEHSRSFRFGLITKSTRL